ncbi:hypothetical protein GCM10010421_23220 [Streptomyces glaucus]|uniref:Uncharacterized protein n=1 Tax=Streptomyces glaucus TaxID=284029 RepID=A0ABN3JNS4_9ACTN
MVIIEVPLGRVGMWHRRLLLQGKRPGPLFPAPHEMTPGRKLFPEFCPYLVTGEPGDAALTKRRRHRPDPPLEICLSKADGRPPWLPRRSRLRIWSDRSGTVCRMLRRRSQVRMALEL